MSGPLPKVPWSAMVLIALLLGSVALARPETPANITVTGTVVDSGDRPVAKATIEARHWYGTRKTATDERGRFELSVPATWLRGLMVVASQDNGQQLAYWQRPLSEEEGGKQPSVRLRLKAARRIEVRVVDKEGQPVANTRVGTRAANVAFGATTTDAKGKALCLIPGDATLQTLYAWKGGKGLDYRAYENRRKRGGPGVKPPPPDGPVVLTLDGATTLRIRALDPEGKPIPNLSIQPSSLSKPSEPATIQLGVLRPEVPVKTDPNGVALFDWLPTWEKNRITFFPVSETHVRQRIEYDPKTGSGTLTVKLDRLVPIRGRVLLPGGKPAANIRVEAAGSGYTLEGFHQRTQTDTDGRFDFRAYPNQIYLVVVEDDRWRAAPRTGFAVLPDQPVTDLDFQLRPATRVHGRVTMGADKKPVAGQWMLLSQQGKDLRSLKGVTLPNPENSRTSIQPTVVRNTRTDKDGCYEFFVGPGEYYLRGPNQAEPKKFEVKDEKALVLDFHAARPGEERLTGQVVTGTPPKPVAGAEVQGIYRHSRAGRDMTAKTDKDGRFDVLRAPSRTIVYARSADKRLAGVVEIAADAKTVTIPVQPVVSAQGRLVDPAGNPLSDREIVYGIRVPIGDDNAGWRMSFGGKIKTDKNGHFVLTNLVVGQLYGISGTMDEHIWRRVGEVQPKDAKPIDLSDLTLQPAYRPPTLEQRIQAAFESKGSPRQRFADAVADARLSRQHVLLVFAEPGSAATRSFFQLRFEDEEVRRALDDYRIVAIPLDAKGLAAAQELARQLKLRLEKRSLPLLAIYDNKEAQRALSEVPSLGKDGLVQRDKLIPFLKGQALAPLDARKLLADALEQARKEKKRVLVQETATWCGPCWLLSRFLDRHRSVWSKDYLWVKIDHRWQHAEAVMDGIRKGQRGGIPWTAILDADGKVLATSNDAKGDNVGFPSSKAGIEHFLSILRKSRYRLSDEEIAGLGKALEQR